MCRKWMVGAVMSLVPLVQAQTAPTFEVASIRANRSGALNSGFRRASPGELNATNISLKMLIAYAYDVQDYQIIGGPNWMESEHYDILAKPAAGAERATPRARVQTLLADRWQLAFHHDTRELPIFALTIAKKGPKLTPSTQAQMDLVTNGHHLTCQKITMDQFARIFLQGQLHRNVVDKTGIKGEFDFSLDWAPDEAAATASEEDRPSLFTALQEKLGLKLESDKGPVETIVIDRAEHPSEN